MNSARGTGRCRCAYHPARTRARSLVVSAIRARAARAARRRLAALQPTCRSWVGWHRPASRAVSESQAHARRSRTKQKRVRLRGKRAASRPVLTPRAVPPPQEERAASPEVPAPKKRRGGPKLPAPTKEMCAKKLYELNAVGGHVLVRQKRVTDRSDLAVRGRCCKRVSAASRCSARCAPARPALWLGARRRASRVFRPHRRGGAPAALFLCCMCRSGQSVAAAAHALTHVLRRTHAQASAT